MKDGEIIAKMAQDGAKVADCGKMCYDCAFRVQEDINGYGATVEKALTLLQHGEGEMNCHTAEFKDAGRPCVGFQYALKAVEHKAVKILKQFKNKS